MYTTINEKGILNNYAKEPQIYCATYPTQGQQRQYTFQAAFATLLVTTLILVSLGVS
jgi:hypothetical protein